MLGSNILEVATGLVFLYILLSLVCSVINEWLMQVRKLRSGLLNQELRRLLGPNLMGALVRHQLVRGMFVGGQFPNYIPGSTFALALMETGFEYTPGQKGLPGTTEVQKRWQGRDRSLLEALRQHASSLSALQSRVEQWYEQAMEQTSGEYKRKVQLWILLISGAIVVGGNIDTIDTANKLYNAAVHSAPVEFPIGWTPPVSWALKIPGLALTWSALSLGAPFWFDLLNKLVNLRHTGLPPDERTRRAAGTGTMAH